MPPYVGNLNVSDTEFVILSILVVIIIVAAVLFFRKDDSDFKTRNFIYRMWEKGFGDSSNDKDRNKD